MASALEDPSWNLIRSYFEEKGMVRSQITSYNELIYKVIPDVITRHGVLAFEHSGNSYKYSLRNPYFGLPSFVESEGDRRYITPNECRLRNLTYQAPLFCDVMASTKTKLGASKTMTEKIMLCHIPVMLKSELCVLRNRTEHEMTELGECMYDHGGYFIINGSEKVLIAQERTAFNQVCCYQDKAGNYLAELRSVPEGVSRAATQVSVILENNKDASKHVPSSLINIKMHYLKDRTVPFVVIFRALGIIDEDEIIRFITVDNDPDIIQLLKPTFEACKVITDSLTACKYIGHCSPYMNASLEQQLNHVQNIILIREFMPHIGSEEKDARSKAYLLGHMIYKCLMTYLGRRDFDDRDHVGNKRLELSGNLLGSTFRIHFSRLIKETTLLLEKKIKASKTISFTSDFDFKSINKMMCSNLSTGNWGTNSGNKGNRTGVTQSLHRLTYAATLSCLRRQVAPIAKEGKSAKPRQLHNSSYGRNCSAETPEGQSCGLIKNLSMLCEISTESSSISIRELLSMENLTPALELQSGAKVFVNGCCMGTTDDPVDIFKKLKEWKLTRLIPSETSIVWNEFENEVNVMTDGGRCLRPLLYIHGRQCEEFVEDLTQAMVANKRWSDLCKLQLVEYLDCREEEHIMCAMRYEDWKHNEFELDYTHLEIHPSMIIGVACSTIPFANTNPAPRLSYQSSQLKQALGIYAMNYQTRFDTQSHVMWYPQKPLLNTKMGDILKVTDMPAGQQCMVAIAVYGGWNQEDSIILNKASIERGLFRTTYYRSYTDSESKNGQHYEQFCVPEEKSTAGRRYELLDNDDGLVAVGMRVTTNDVIIGKTTPVAPVATQDESLSTKPKFLNKDSSRVLRAHEYGIVDAVMLTQNENDRERKMVKVRLRKTRIPEIGDKLSSRAAQKGTIGMILPQEDMPFTSEGITPDLIINPHAIPSQHHTA